MKVSKILLKESIPAYRNVNILHQYITFYGIKCPCICFPIWSLYELYDVFRGLDYNRYEIKKDILGGKKVI